MLFLIDSAQRTHGTLHFAPVVVLLDFKARMRRIRSLIGGILGIVAASVSSAALSGPTPPSLILTWTDNSNNETGFAIERSVAGGAFAIIARTGPNVVSYTDLNLATATTYSYRLRAYAGTLYSAYTTVVSAMTPAAAVASPTPTPTPVPTPTPTPTPTPNVAPVISDVAARTIPAMGTTGAIPFTVSDSTTAAALLTVTGSSSNSTLIPTSAILFGGSGSNRTVTITPAGSFSGSATVTLTVSDGSLTATDTFVVTVTPPNLPPTQSAMSARTLETGSSTGAMGFTIGDSTTPVSLLTVSVSSSNSTLLPTTAMVLGGSGANRTLSLTPAAGVLGTAQVTLSVSDGVFTTTQAFVLTVVPVNRPPAITGLANLTTSTNGRVRLPLVVSDSETAAAQLTVSAVSSNPQLLAQAAIRFEGTGSTRTFAADLVSGATGTTTITIALSDGGKLTLASFTITVVPQNTPPWITALANLSSRTYYMAGQSFQAGDAETSARSLLLTATSSNEALIPSSGIYFSSNETDRAIAVVPVRGRTGTAVITVRVSDGVLSLDRSFTVTVTP